MMEPITFAGFMVVLCVVVFALGRFQGFARGSTWSDDRDAIMDAAQAEEEAMLAAGDNGLGKKIAGAIDVPFEMPIAEDINGHRRPSAEEVVTAFEMHLAGDRGLRDANGQSLNYMIRRGKNTKVISSHTIEEARELISYYKTMVRPYHDTPRPSDPFPETIHIFKPPFIGGTFTVRLLEAMDAALKNRFGDPLAARYVVNGVRLSAWRRDALVQFRRYMIENTLGFKGEREPETKGPLWAVQGQATWDSERRGWFITKDHTTHVAIPAADIRHAPDFPLFEMPGTIHGGHDGSLIDDDKDEMGDFIDGLGMGDL